MNDGGGRAKHREAERICKLPDVCAATADGEGVNVSVVNIR